MVADTVPRVEELVQPIDLNILVKIADAELEQLLEDTTLIKLVNLIVPGMMSMYRAHKQNCTATTLRTPYSSTSRNP